MDEDQKHERIPVLQYAPVARRRPDTIRWLARVLTVLIVVPVGLLGVYVGVVGISDGTSVDRIIAVGVGLVMLVYAIWFLRTSINYGRIDRQRPE